MDFANHWKDSRALECCLRSVYCQKSFVFQCSHHSLLNFRTTRILFAASVRHCWGHMDYIQWHYIPWDMVETHLKKMNHVIDWFSRKKTVSLASISDDNLLQMLQFQLNYILVVIKSEISLLEVLRLQEFCLIVARVFWLSFYREVIKEETQGHCGVFGRRFLNKRARLSQSLVFSSFSSRQTRMRRHFCSVCSIKRTTGKCISPRSLFTF